MSRLRWLEEARREVCERIIPPKVSKVPRIAHVKTRTSGPRAVLTHRVRVPGALSTILRVASNCCTNQELIADLRAWAISAEEAEQRAAGEPTPPQGGQPE